MNVKRSIITISVLSLVATFTSIVALKSPIRSPFAKDMSDFSAFNYISEKSLMSAQKYLSKEAASLVIDKVNGEENPFYDGLRRSTKLVLTQIAINIVEKKGRKFKNREKTLNKLNKYLDDLEGMAG